jgi:N-acetylglucosaminyldiphosphoundecaprenol N-acetyl-beta-D-mannosaminyltransferase
VITVNEREQVNSESLLDYRVVNDDLDRCVDSIGAWIATGDRGKWFACMNPHSWVVARTNPAFAEALNQADWLVPDGQGIVLASRVFGGEIRQRVTGSDIFTGINGLLDRTGGRVFFLGSTEETLAGIRQRVERDWPGIEVAGTWSPPFVPRFTADDTSRMIDAINAARPQVLWVGMTAPKQEMWVSENIHRLETVRFAGAIGAVFDFHTGTIRRSHPLFLKTGLEWLPRLLREPRRLWRRNFVSSPLFLLHLAARRLGVKQ